MTPAVYLSGRAHFGRSSSGTWMRSHSRTSSRSLHISAASSTWLFRKPIDDISSTSRDFVFASILIPCMFQRASFRISFSTSCLVLLPISTFGALVQPFILFSPPTRVPPSTPGSTSPGICSVALLSLSLSASLRFLSIVAFSASLLSAAAKGSASYIQALPLASSSFFMS